MYAADMDKAELQRRLRDGSLGEKIGGAVTVIGENVIGGFVDDYDSPGERLGSGINYALRNPLETGVAVAEGIAGLVKQASNPDDLEGSARAALELAMMVPTAGVTTALATGSRLADLVEFDPDTLRSFIGPKGAKMLADEGDSSAAEALEHAAALQEMGVDYNEIRALVNNQIAETNPYFGGISKNAAGQWVVEVDDRLTVSRPGVAKKVMDQGIAEGTVDELIVGSGLPRQMLRDTPGEFKYGPDEGGRRSDGSVYATSKSMQGGVPIMMHEMDHVSMRLEGNAPGGAPGHVLTGRYVPTAGDYDRVIAILEMEPGSAIRDNLFATMTDTQRRAYDLVLGGAGGDELMALDTARKGADIMRRGNISHEIYDRLSGEVQARNVMTRMRMTPEERRATDPAFTEDRLRSEQINQGPDGYQMLQPIFDPREYAEGGAATMDPREASENMADVEYEQQILSTADDALVRLGLDPSVARVTTRSDSYSPTMDRLNIDANHGLMSPETQAHEYRHRGLDILLKDYIKLEPFTFRKKYGPDAWKLAEKLWEQSRFGKSPHDVADSVQEQVAELFQKPATVSRTEFYSSDGRVFQSRAEVEKHIRQNPDLEYTANTVTRNLEDTLETPRVAEFRDYMVNKNRGETPPRDPYFESVLSLQEAASDALKGKYFGYANGGGVASLNSVARNMTRGPRGLSGFIPYMKGY